VEDVEDVEVERVVARRRAAGRHAFSVSWGPWDGDGMRAPEGLRPVPPGLAMAVLDDATEWNDPFRIVVDVEWERFLGATAAERHAPLLRGVPEAARILDASTAAEGSAGLLERLRTADGGEAEALLVGVLRSQAAAVLGHVTTGALDVDSSLLDMGFSSFTVLELSNRIRQAIGIEVPPPVVFDHPTLTSLAGFLRTNLVGPRATDTAGAREPAAPGRPLFLPEQAVPERVDPASVGERP
jgi:aryl carrier-like protein